MTRRYPLDLLQRSRAAKVETTSLALSSSHRRVSSAEGEVERRVQTKAELERSFAATSDAERARLEQGALTPADLERAASWKIGADLQRTAQERLVDEAKGALGRAREDAEQKRQSLSLSQRDAELVEKHHDKWRASQQKAATAKEEEAIEESFLARSSGKARS
ncbi:MAG TPA: hypothetical protein VGL13_09010 [Polyangiaceae bacterium]